MRLLSFIILICENQSREKCVNTPDSRNNEKKSEKNLKKSLSNKKFFSYSGTASIVFWFVNIYLYRASRCKNATDQSDFWFTVFALALSLESGSNFRQTLRQLMTFLLYVPSIVPFVCTSKASRFHGDKFCWYLLTNWSKLLKNKWSFLPIR